MEIRFGCPICASEWLIRFSRDGLAVFPREAGQCREHLTWVLSAGGNAILLVRDPIIQEGNDGRIG
jgi:hypothetical protein